jgi:hypothetical protein
MKLVVQRNVFYRVYSALIFIFAAFVCRQSYDSGQMSNNIDWSPTTRYYYNASLHRCMPFTFNGLMGNFNNFLKYNDCMQFCSTPPIAIVVVD